MHLKQLGSRLRYIRKQAGISREYIEKKYNIPAVTIRSWELLEPDIGIHKLVKYLEIYKNYDLNISLDILLLRSHASFAADYCKSINEEYCFLNSSFCSSLLQNTTQVFFYANKYNEVLYLSNTYKKLLTSSNMRFTQNYITIQNIIPHDEYKKCLLQISEVLNGKRGNIRYSIKQDNIQTAVQLSLLPNFDQFKNVIGFVAINQSAAVAEI